MPFTRVYAGTTPIVYQLEQFVRWGYGPVAGLLAIAGVPLLLAIAWRRGSAASVVLVSWLIAYGSVVSVSEVKFLRYLEPLSPVFAICTALAIVALGRVLCERRVPPFARALAAFLVIAIAAWTGAFLTIYAHENSRLAASRWMFETVPPGSTLTTEYWDDALPKSLGYALSPSTFGFSLSTLDLYRDDPPQQAIDAIYDVILGLITSCSRRSGLKAPFERSHGGTRCKDDFTICSTGLSSGFAKSLLRPRHIARERSPSMTALPTNRS